MDVRSTAPTAAERLLSAFEGAMGIPIPVHVRCWDGSDAGPDSDVTIVFRNRRAIRRVLWSPNELGLVRAYVSGDLEIEGDVFRLLTLPDLVDRLGTLGVRGSDRGTILKSLSTFVRLGGLGLRPTPPSVEVARRRGPKHSKARDASSVSHHYDVGNDFYRLFLGPTMVYSCGYRDQRSGDRGAIGTLEEAQNDKLDLVCRKLGSSRACDCWTWAAAGVRWRSTPPRSTTCPSSASPSATNRPSGRVRGSPRPGCRI